MLARCFLRLVAQSSSRRVRVFRNVGSLKLILKRRTCLRKRVAIFAFCTTILFVSISPSQAQQDQSDARARKMLTKVVPIYPSLAQRMCIAGSVKIEVLVAPNGSAKSTQILGGHPVLAQAGVEAIRYCKWETATHETKEIVIFNFHPN